MKKLLGAAFALALVFGGASGAGAGDNLGTLTLNPTSGPPESTFTVSGSDCVARDGGEMSVEVTAPDTVEVTATAVPDDAGDWSTTLTVPADAMEGDTIVVNAECIEDFGAVPNSSFQGFRAPTGQSISQAYSPATFTVTAAPSTTVDDTTTTTEPDGEVDDADAAAPVVAQPTFTG